MTTRKRAHELFDIRVSDEQFARAAAIFEALRSALTARGFAIAAYTPHDRRFTCVEKDGVRVALHIYEKSNQYRTSDRWGPRVELVRNGKLALRLGWDPHNTDEAFRDGVRRRLEDQIEAIVDRCIRTHAETVEYRRGVEERRVRAAAEEQERKRIEEEQRQAESRRQRLLGLAHAWQDSCLLHAFADELDRLLQGRLSDQGREWLATARREADAMDPLRLHRQHE